VLQTLQILIIAVGVVAIFYEIVRLHRKLLEWKGVDFAVLWLLITLASTSLLGVAVMGEDNGFRFWLPLCTTTFLFILPSWIAWRKNKKRSN
jgi:hypothetical protein